MIFDSGNHNFDFAIPQARVFGHPNYKHPRVSIWVFVSLIIRIMLSLFFCCHLFFGRFAKRAIRPNILLPNYNYYNSHNCWKCAINFTNLVAYRSYPMEHRQLINENSIYLNRGISHDFHPTFHMSLFHSAPHHPCNESSGIFFFKTKVFKLGLGFLVRVIVSDRFEHP